MIYSSNKKYRLQIEDVCGPDSESEHENSSDNEQMNTPKCGKHQTEDEKQSTLRKTFKNGDFILAKLA